MATPPDFVAGNVLTAAQMNQIGLWLVKEQTVGTAVSSVTVSNCFNADYDAYRVVYTNVDGTVATNAVEVQLVDSGGTPATTNYALTGIFMTYTATTVNGLNGTTWSFALGDVNAGAAFDVYNPYLAVPTYSAALTADVFYMRCWGLKHTTAASYTGLKFIPVASTMTGGTIRVYGYRN